MYYTYVIYSEDYDRRYIGHTSNLEARLKYHNAGKVRSTKPWQPWRLVYTEKFETRADAVKRERYLKTGWGRLWLDKILQ